MVWFLAPPRHGPGCTLRIRTQSDSENLPTSFWCFLVNWMWLHSMFMFCAPDLHFVLGSSWQKHRKLTGYFSPGLTAGLTASIVTKGKVPECDSTRCKRGKKWQCDFPENLDQPEKIQHVFDIHWWSRLVWHKKLDWDSYPYDCKKLLVDLRTLGTAIINNGDRSHECFWCMPITWWPCGMQIWNSRFGSQMRRPCHEVHLVPCVRPLGPCAGSVLRVCSQRQCDHARGLVPVRRERALAGEWWNLGEPRACLWVSDDHHHGERHQHYQLVIFQFDPDEHVYVQQ